LPDSPVREARKGVLKVDNLAEAVAVLVLAVLAVDLVLAADLVAGVELGQVAGQVVEAVLVLAVDQVEAVPELAVDPVEVAAGPVAVAVAEAVFHSWSSQIQFSRLCRCR
jgi:hypothetical protein